MSTVATVPVGCRESPAVPLDVAHGVHPISAWTSWRPTGEAGFQAHLARYGALTVPDRDSAPLLLSALATLGLSGRGGGGFPTARKLEGHRRPGGGIIVVNAMEGEPASTKDSAVLAWAPHLVLDGAQVAAAVTGAHEIVICVPADRDGPVAPLSVALAERAARLRRETPVWLARPPGRYVAGEESALAGWLDRRHGVPALRLEKATALRVGGRPALVHNVETLAQVALVWSQVRAGSFDAGRTGLTTLVTVSGAVCHPGVLAVPVGTPVAAILGQAGADESTAAALIGGYGGAWIASSDFTTPFSGPALRAVGASPGAGVVLAVTEQACGLATTQRIAAFMAGESSGQCGPCVYGLPAIAEDLAQLAGGRGGEDTLRRLDGRLAVVDGRGACRHPDGVVRMVQSALRVFRSDVDRHVRGRPCGGRAFSSRTDLGQGPS